MAAEPNVLRLYTRHDGKKPFQEWMDLLHYQTQVRIAARLERVRLGIFGDWKSLGEGVFELRIDVGPGYSVYFGRDGKSIVILLCGGSKASQRKDISDAKMYWKDYRSFKNATKRTV